MQKAFKRSVEFLLNLNGLSFLSNYTFFCHNDVNLLFSKNYLAVIGWILQCYIALTNILLLLFLLLLLMLLPLPLPFLITITTV